MRLRQEGAFSTDSDVIRSALHALHHEWQSNQWRPAREPALEVTEVTDEILLHRANTVPEDYDT